MKQATIINIITLITFGIMKAAWELATEGQKLHGGKKAQYLGESMRQAWAVKKAGCTQEAALAAGGYELGQRQKEEVKKLKQQTALAAQKETRVSVSDAAIMAEYMDMRPVLDITPVVKKEGVAEFHDAYAMYAAMPNITRKPAKPDYEFNQDISMDFNQDVQDDYAQESQDDESASQDESDSVKCCAGCAKDFRSESLVVRMKKTGMGRKYLSYCPVCVAKHDAQDTLFNTKVQYKRNLKPAYTRNRANWTY